MFTQVEAESAVNQAKIDIEKRTSLQLPTLLTNFSQSLALYEEAKKHLPSGATSNVRVYAHEPFSISFQKGQGSRVWDVDNNQYVDRSEEHTSELQSPCNLVCRLLLEKK